MSDDHVILPDEDPPSTAAGDGIEGADAPAAAAADPIGPVCSECGTHIEPNQQYCLACGAPTPFAVPLRGRRSTPALIAASLLALGIGGASIIYAATKDDTKQTGDVSVPTVNTLPTIPTFPTGTNPFPTGSTINTVPTFSTPTVVTTYTQNNTVTTTYTVTVTRTTGTSTTPTTNYDESDDWPYQNETRWTIVMRSYEDVVDAKNYCATLKSNNFSCGILNSDFYGSLNPNYFVVFHKAYTTEAKAKTALAAVKTTYPSAYVRKIEL